MSGVRGLFEEAEGPTCKEERTSPPPDNPRKQPPVLGQFPLPIYAHMEACLRCITAIEAGITISFTAMEAGITKVVAATYTVMKMTRVSLQWKRE